MKTETFTCMTCDAKALKQHMIKIDGDLSIAVCGTCAHSIKTFLTLAARHRAEKKARA